jgi:hypothetical protein
MGRSRDHILPQFNLKEFSIDKKHVCGWIHSKNKKCDKILIDKTASRKGFYDTQTNGNMPDLENQKIEANIKPIIHKIINEEILNAEDVQLFYDFLFNRIFRSFIMQDFLNKSIKTHQKEFDYDYVKTYTKKFYGMDLPMKDFKILNDCLNEIFKDKPKMSIIPRIEFMFPFYISLLFRGILLLENKSDAGFVISDNGFALLSEPEKDRIKFLEGIIIPYTDRYCFLMEEEKFPEEIKQLSEDSKNGKKIINIRPFKMIKIVCDKENIITQYNNFLFKYSSYITYSKNPKDLNFIQKIKNTHELKHDGITK